MLVAGRGGAHLGHRRQERRQLRHLPLGQVTNNTLPSFLFLPFIPPGYLDHDFNLAFIRCKEYLCAPPCPLVN